MSTNEYYNSRLIVNKNQGICVDGRYFKPTPHFLINGRYKIVNEIGRGSYGNVIKAIDRSESKYVAIKMFRDYEKYRNAAVREYKMLYYLQQIKEVNTDNIVKLFDFFSYENHSCISFELLHSDLAKLIDFKSTNMRKMIDLRIMKTVIKSTLMGVINIHKCGMIHGDLKPHNIALVSKDNYSCKLLDFGMAVLSSENAMYRTIQTQCYRAPEVWLQVSYSEKMDIFSIGVILVEMITRKHSLLGDSPIKQMDIYVELFGMPPKFILEQSRVVKTFFTVTKDGTNTQFTPRTSTLKPKSKRIEDLIGINDTQIIDFLQKCFAMDPNRRLSAKELLNHPWLKDTV